MRFSPFDRAAETFNHYAAPQLAVAKELGKMLPTQASYVLEIGPGTGYLSRQLIGRFPDANFVFVEASAPMTAQLSAHFSEDTHTQVICQDFCTADLEDGFDLVASSSALHWLDPLDYALTRVRRVMASDGIFVASVAVEGTLAELSGLKQAINSNKILSLRFPTIETVQRGLREAGFTITFERVFEYRIKFPSGRHLFQHLRATGVNGAPVVTDRMSRTELGTLLRATEAGIEATYRSYLFRAE